MVWGVRWWGSRNKWCEPALVQFRADSKGSAAIWTKIRASSESFIHCGGVPFNGPLLLVLIRKLLYADLGRKIGFVINGVDLISLGKTVYEMGKGAHFQEKGQHPHACESCVLECVPRKHPQS